MGMLVLPHGPTPFLFRTQMAYLWSAGFLYRNYEKERHHVSISYAEISTLPLRMALVKDRAIKKV